MLPSTFLLSHPRFYGRGMIPRPSRLLLRNRTSIIMASTGDVAGDRVQPAAQSPSPAPETKQSSAQAKPKSNAFTELMKPKPKIQPTGDNNDKESMRTRDLIRDGLVAYTIDPERFPSSRVVYYDEKFVVINDMFPKANVHLLILPRDPKKNVLRPQEAFDDRQFLEACKAEENKVRSLVAEELRRRFGHSSKAEEARIRAMEADDPPEELPPGRDWLQDVKSGIHANPSMNHLHIHVMSKDMVSEPMKKSNHYLSFTTDFFVGLEHFPLSKDDYRRRYGSFREKGMLCWRCGKDFGHEMKKLKAHLKSEFEEWKRE